MSAKTGREAKAYRNDGTWASPSWLELENARDLSLAYDADFPEVSSRASKHKKYLQGMIDSPIEMDFVYDQSDADCVALLDAALNDTNIEIAIMDGDIAVAGAEGLRAEWKVGFNRAEPLTEGMTITFALRIAADSSNAPTWYTVTT